MNNSAHSHTTPKFLKTHYSNLLLPGCDRFQQYSSVKFTSFEKTIQIPVAL